jgi:hypothetical protein
MFKSLLATGMFLSLVIFLTAALHGQERGTVRERNQEADPGAAATADGDFAPVDDMHHFMEIAWQPGYRFLRENLKAEPENRRTWRDVKAHAMIMAELCRVVADRKPEGLSEEKAKLWAEICKEVNQHAKELYASSGKLPESQAAYGKMIDACNRCHNEFENGRHLLEK